MTIIDSKIMKKLQIISEKEIEPNFYKVVSTDNFVYFMQVSDKSNLDNTLDEYRFYKKLSENNVPTLTPLKFDIYNDKVYTFFDYIDKQPLSDYLKTISNKKQYELGMDAGIALRNIHATSVSSEQQDTTTADIENVLSKLKISTNKNSKKIIDFINDNIHLLNNRQQSFIHGDFQINNLVINRGELTVLNFKNSAYDDKFKDFLPININASTSKFFATGQLIGYFEQQIPVTFFNILALYKIIEIISDYNFDENNIDYILALYDNMKNVMPSWYQETINSLNAQVVIN